MPKTASCTFPEELPKGKSWVVPSWCLHPWPHASFQTNKQAAPDQRPKTRNSRLSCDESEIDFRSLAFREPDNHARATGTKKSTEVRDYGASVATSLGGELTFLLLPYEHVSKYPPVALCLGHKRQVGSDPSPRSSCSLPGVRGESRARDLSLEMVDS